MRINRFNWKWEADNDLIFAENKMIRMLDANNPEYHEIVLIMYLYYMREHMKKENWMRSYIGHEQN